MNLASASLKRERRVLVWLTLFFLALALPALWLAHRAYSESQWEVFYRFQAEARQAVERVDAELRNAIAREEARAYSDYQFFQVEADNTQTLLRRSELSAYPMDSLLPGLIGYFEVNSAGALSSPILPAANSNLDSAGLGPEELRERRQLLARLRSILSSPGEVAESSKLARRPETTDEDRPEIAATPPQAVHKKRTRNVFDRLLSSQRAQQNAQQGGRYDNSEESYVSSFADADLAIEAEQQSLSAPAPAAKAPARQSRREKVAVLAAPKSSPSPAQRQLIIAADEVAGDAVPAAINKEAAARSDSAHSYAGNNNIDASPVRFFDSEIDPMTVAVLDEQYLVLFRNVWRDGERFIQGALIQRDLLIESIIAKVWRRSPLASHSGVRILWNHKPLYAEGTRPGSGISSPSEILFRSRLSAPFAPLELLYTAGELPQARSATYLIWVAASFLLVLAVGCIAIMRFIRSQNRLVEQQSNFVSAVSHELKTPLTSIRMYSEMLSAGWTDENRKQHYYRLIHDESERLSRLINNVLQLARAEREQLSIQTDAVSVAQVLERAEEKLRAQVSASGFEFECKHDKEAPETHISVDEDAVQQILINLVDNAIKFTPAGAAQRIVLSSERIGTREVAIRVRDYGKGIPPEQMRRIFDLFYRAETELTRETTGTGIGLALVQQLAQAMGARIDVANCEPGSEFTLIVPQAVSRCAD